MIRLSLRCAASRNQFGSAYGYGRTYNSFVKHIGERSDVRLVDSAAGADIQVCMCYPHRRIEEFAWWGRRRHRVQVIYTTWETTAIPVDWAEVMNECSAVFSPSRWCCGVLRDNGINVPIHWTPNAADPLDFPYIWRNWTAGEECELWDGKKFVFLWQGMHPADRKGMIYAQKAFAALNLSDAWLVEKWYPVVSAPFGPVVYDERRLTQIGRILDRGTYLRLLSKCHVSLNPFRGESPGQMPLETASTGMFTVATNWSGATDYIHPRWFSLVDRIVPDRLKSARAYQRLDKRHFWPLKYELSEPGKDFISTSPYNDIRLAEPWRSQDAVPDIEDLKAAMLWAYENREAAAETGERASRYVQSKWNWKAAAERMVAACRMVLDER